MGSASPRSVLMSLRDTWERLHYAVGLLLGRGDTVFPFKSFGGGGGDLCVTGLCKHRNKSRF